MMGTTYDELRAPGTAVQFFGCLGAMASATALPFLAILALITNPSLAPTFDRVWAWAALGLSLVNIGVCVSLMRSFGWVKLTWFVGSSVAIIATCPHI